MEILFTLGTGTTPEALLKRLFLATDSDLAAFQKDVGTVSQSISDAGAKGLLDWLTVAAGTVIESRKRAEREAAQRKAAEAAQRAAEEAARRATVARLEAEAKEAAEAARREAARRAAELARREAARQAAELARREAVAREAADAARREAEQREAAEAARRAAQPVQWYYTLDRKHGHGPLSTAELRAVIAAGTLTPESLVSMDGKKWRRAASLQGVAWPQQPTA